MSGGAVIGVEVEDVQRPGAQREAQRPIPMIVEERIVTVRGGRSALTTTAALARVGWRTAFGCPCAGRAQRRPAYTTARERLFPGFGRLWHTAVVP
jgi:hypothetical protein